MTLQIIELNILYCYTYKEDEDGANPVGEEQWQKFEISSKMKFEVNLCFEVQKNSALAHDILSTYVLSRRTM